MTNKNTGEVFADIVRVNSEEVIHIDVDAFLPLTAPTSGAIEWSTEILATVRAIDGFPLTGHFARTSDGTVGFVQYVNLYPLEIIRNTVLDRSSLRSQFPNILSTEEAHHLIPVGLLDNDVVQAAVVQGFDFNGVINGMPLQKYVDATGVGRHGPHPQYTAQINEVFTKLGNQGVQLSPMQAKQLMENLVDGNSKYQGIRNIINTTSDKIKINALDLKLSNINVLDLLGS